MTFELSRGSTVTLLIFRSKVPTSTSLISTRPYPYSSTWSSITQSYLNYVYLNISFLVFFILKGIDYTRENKLNSLFHTNFVNFVLLFIHFCHGSTSINEIGVLRSPGLHLTFWYRTKGFSSASQGDTMIKKQCKKDETVLYIINIWKADKYWGG